MIFVGFNAFHLIFDLAKEYVDHVVQIDSFAAVRVEANKHPLAAVDHVKVVVTNLFVCLIVTAVTELVGFDREHGGPNELAMVDTATVRAITMMRINGAIMDELSWPLKVQSVPYTNFLGMLIHDDTAGILRKYMLETGCAKPVIL